MANFFKEWTEKSKKNFTLTEDELALSKVPSIPREKNFETEKENKKEEK